MKLFILCFLFSIQSFAQVFFDSAQEQRLNWSAGTSATYKLHNLISNKSETFTVTVTKVSSDKAWLERNFRGKNYVTIYDLNTGKLLETWIDGELSEGGRQEQPGEWTVIDSQVTNITVPAGTYRAQYTNQQSFNFFYRETWRKADKDSATPFEVLRTVMHERFYPNRPWQEFTLISEKIVR